MGKGRKGIDRKRQPEAASVTILTDDEEESTDDDAAGVEEWNGIEDSHDFYKPTTQEDDPTQLHSQHFEGTDSAPRENPNKRRSYHIIPEDQEVTVVEWYRDQQFLYNKKMRTYRDRGSEGEGMGRQKPGV